MAMVVAVLALSSGNNLLYILVSLLVATAHCHRSSRRELVLGSDRSPAAVSRAGGGGRGGNYRL
jgi:hypothetical protein